MAIMNNEMLWHQFGAAIDMFGDALRDCPDEVWEKSLWEDQPDQWVAAGFSAFWYLCYHTLFWLDLYLTGRKRALLRLRHLTWLRWIQPICFRGSIHAKSCSATWNTAAESARRRLALCQTDRHTGCAGSLGESCPMRSFSCTICAMYRNTAHNCACSWDSRRGNPQAGYPGLSKKLLPDTGSRSNKTF